MATAYHTNGTATITVGGSTLGLTSADGVEITITTFKEFVYSDERGPHIPAEVIQCGPIAKITGELYKFDPTVLETFLTQSMGGATGAMGTIGLLMLTNTKYSSVQIDSPLDSQKWLFGTTFILDDLVYKLSTQLKSVPFTFMAIPDSSNNLYSHPA